ncbi:MAG: hypothetical protein U0W24_10750 [Bacteroidales bacterium]
MKNLAGILYLFVFLFLLLTVIGFFNTLFSLNMVNKFNVPFPEDWVSVIVFLGLSIFLFLIALICGSDKIATKYKAAVLISIPVIIVLLIILDKDTNPNNKFNNAYKLAEDKILQGDYKGAIVEYSNAIEADSIQYVYYMRRGEAREHSDQFDSALMDYTRAIELNKYDSYLFYLRGKLKINLKDSVNGLKDLQLSESMGGESAKLLLKSYK